MSVIRFAHIENEYEGLFKGSTYNRHNRYTGQDGAYLAEFLLQKGYLVHGETFVVRKITRAPVGLKLGMQKCLYLRNLDAKRLGTSSRLCRDSMADATAA